MILIGFLVLGVCFADYAFHKVESNSTFVHGVLEFVGEDPSPHLGPLERKVDFFAVFRGSCARIRMVGSNFSQWEVPTWAVDASKGMERCGGGDLEVGLRVLENSPFSFEVYRLSDGKEIWSMPAGVLMVRKEFVRIGTVLDSLPKVNNDVAHLVGPPGDSYGPDRPKMHLAVGEGPYLYGFGERIGPLRMPPGNFTIWTHDQGPPGTDGNILENYYGQHPVYFAMEEGGKAHGAFWLNANAQNVEIGFGDNGTDAPYAPEGVKKNFPSHVSVYDKFGSRPYLGWTSVGGVVDLMLFAGPTLSEATQQYHSILGEPASPPRWALGYHQSRDGYKTVEITRGIVETFNKDKIPLDCIWNDLDYMDGNRDWTLDPVRFPEAEMREFVEDLHGGVLGNKNYVYIVDPAIAAHNESYGTWMRLNASGAYVRTSGGVQPFQGRLWAKPISWWPDFTHPNATSFMSTELRLFHDRVPADGLWIDENEVSELCNQGSTQWGPCPFNGDGGSDPVLPFVPPTHNGTLSDLSFGSLNVSAKQWNDELQFNHHSLYGFEESLVARQALINLEPQDRPFLLSRSTFPGSGRLGAHWLGDSESYYFDLWASLPGTALVNLFGIPLSGADICGFIHQPTAELCTEWIKTSLLAYGFTRNHAGGTPQEPFAFGEPYTSINRQAIRQRYQLMPYLSTLFFLATSNLSSLPFKPSSSVVARALSFEFPQDINTWALDRCLMLGPAVLTCPNLSPNASTYDIYLPPSSRWYDLTTHLEAKSTGVITLNASLHESRTHIRGGYVLPSQTQNDSILSTKDAESLPINLLVPLNNEGEATGTLAWDEPRKTMSPSQAHILGFSMLSTSFTVTTIQPSKSINPPPITAVSILGLLQTSPIKQVLFNGQIGVATFKQQGFNLYITIPPTSTDFTLELVFE